MNKNDLTICVDYCGCCITQLLMVVNTHLLSLVTLESTIFKISNDNTTLEDGFFENFVKKPTVSSRFSN
jgi:hypothetical protein